MRSIFSRISFILNHCLWLTFAMKVIPNNLFYILNSIWELTKSPFQIWNTVKPLWVDSLFKWSLSLVLYSILEYIESLIYKKSSLSRHPLYLDISFPVLLSSNRGFTVLRSRISRLEIKKGLKWASHLSQFWSQTHLIKLKFHIFYCFLWEKYKLALFCSSIMTISWLR